MNILYSPKSIVETDGVEVQARPDVDNEQPTSIFRSSRQVDDTQVESTQVESKSKLDITTSSDAQLDITSDAHIKSDIEADAQVLPSFSSNSNIKTPILSLLSCCWEAVVDNLMFYFTF